MPFSPKSKNNMHLKSILKTSNQEQVRKHLQLGQTSRRCNTRTSKGCTVVVSSPTGIVSPSVRSLSLLLLMVSHWEVDVKLVRCTHFSFLLITAFLDSGSSCLGKLEFEHQSCLVVASEFLFFFMFLTFLHFFE